MATDYTKLDEAIVRDIADGARGGFTYRDKLLRIADPLAKPRQYGSLVDRDGWRVIDRRLQALRKAGRITWSRAEGWQIAQPPEGSAS